MSYNEFTDWFDTHDDELLFMECEDVARAAFFAGMKAAQQSVQSDAASLSAPDDTTGAFDDSIIGSLP